MSSTESLSPISVPAWCRCLHCFQEGKNYAEDHQFILLPCFHVICAGNSCWDEVFRDPSSKHPSRCPACSRPIPITKETKGVTIQVADFVQKPPKICTLCIRKGSAVAFCPECDRFLCGNCAEHHAFAVKTASHTLSDMLDLSPKPALCSRHHGHQVNNYCLSHDVVLCPLCRCGKEGKDCELCSVEEARACMTRNVGEFRTVIGNQLTELQKLQSDVRVKIGRLLTTEKDYLLKEARCMLTVLISKLYSRENELRSEIAALTQNSASTLELKEMECDLTSKSVAQYEQFVESLVATASEIGEDVTREGWLVGYRLAKKWLPEQLEKMAKFNHTFFELGHHFRMDKSGLQAVERDLPNFCKISYTHAPNTKRSLQMQNSERLAKNRASLLPPPPQPQPIIISAQSLATNKTPQKTAPKPALKVITMPTSPHPHPPQPLYPPAPVRNYAVKRTGGFQPKLPHPPPPPPQLQQEKDPLADDDEEEHELSIEPVEFTEIIEPLPPSKVKAVSAKEALDEAEPAEQVLDFDLDSDEGLKKLKILGGMTLEDLNKWGTTRVISSSSVPLQLPLQLQLPVVLVDRREAEAPTVENAEIAEPTLPILQPELQVPTELEQTLGEMAEEFKKEEGGDKTEAEDKKPRKSSRKSQLATIVRDDEGISFEGEEPTPAAVGGGEEVENRARIGGRKSPRRRQKRKSGGAGDNENKDKEKDRIRQPGKREIKRKQLDAEFTSPLDKKSPPPKKMRAKRKRLSLDPLKTTSDSDHDDYCGVCRDGGEDLICCEACPRVIHPSCHIPALSGIPEGAFFCNFCSSRDVACDPGKQPEKHLRQKDSTGIHGDEMEFFKACKFLSEVFKWENEFEWRVVVEGVKEENSSESTLYRIRKRLALNEPKPFADAGEMLGELEDLFKSYSELLKPRSRSSQELDRLKKFDKKFSELLSEYYPTFERS